MEKLSILNGVFEDWVAINKFNLDAEIADEVQTINCDTRDFALGWNFEKPKSYKKASCGLESESNKGISKLYNLFTKTDETRAKYSINKKDILKWLDELCQKTGGYYVDWRYLSANVKNCENWNIKYIRFVRNSKNPDEFIVCNSYFFPIEYKNIIDNLKKSKY